MNSASLETPSADGAAKTLYRPDIDGLRAVAVLGVVAFHSGMPYFPGGFVGVDVFFVISGFLITGLLSAEFERTGTINLRSFFVRRIRRLLPALTLVVLVTLIIAALSMFPLDLHRVGKSAQAVATLVANVHFRNFSGGYFDPSTDVMPLLHIWSLAVEEQYYLVWPLLFLLIHRIWRSRNGDIHHTTVVTLGLMFVASFTACLWVTSHDRLSAFYLTPYRAWEFALGALLAQSVPLLQKRLRSRTGDALFIAGMAAIIGTMLFYDDRIPFPGTIAFIPVAGSVAVIAAGCASAAVLPSRLLGNRLMVGIGLISYSLYLWHWPLLALARDYSLGSRSLPRDSAIIAFSFLLAWLTYRYVENPIRYRRPGPFVTIRGSFRVAFLSSLLVVAAANGLMHWSKGKNAELNTVARNASLAPTAGVGNHCVQMKDGLALPPAADCLVGPHGAPVRLVAWGDSHAGQLAAMLARTSKDFGIATLMRNLGACPPLVGSIPFKRNEPQYGCGHFNEQVLSEIAERSHGDLRGVVLAGRWNNYMALPVTQPGGTYAYALGGNWKIFEQNNDNDFEVGKPPLDSSGSMAMLEDSLRSTLISLVTRGLRVVVVAPAPELYFNGPQCLYRRTAEECTVPRAKVEARRSMAVSALKKAVSGIENVRFFDPIDEFCDVSTCYTKRNGLIQYGDDQHISPEMSLALRKRMNPLLMWAAGLD